MATLEGFKERIENPKTYTKGTTVANLGKLSSSNKSNKMAAVGRALGKGVTKAAKVAGFGAGLMASVGKKALGMKNGRVERFTQSMMPPRGPSDELTQKK